MNYYVINYGKDRMDFMKNQFMKFGIDEKDVTWVIHPNKEDLTEELVNRIYDINRFNDHQIFKMSLQETLPKGMISCSYKHYLSLLDIIEKDLEYGVIMEDNIEFRFNVNNAIEQYLKELPENWDIMFEGDICNLHVKNLEPNKFVYNHYATRGLNFYLVSNNGAKKLVEKIIPFSLNLDNFINILIDKKELELNLFWGELRLVHKINREQTWKEK